MSPEWDNCTRERCKGVASWTAGCEM